MLRKQTSLPPSGSSSFPPLRSVVRGREFRASFSLPMGQFHSVTLMEIAGALQLKYWFFQTAEKRLHALGEEEYASVCEILAFKGKCAVEKEGIIGEIKLKCRKKKISNRRELLPVVLAKMLLRCSVRIHRCTGSPADYPNIWLSWRVLGKLSCFYSLREKSSSVQFWPQWLSCPLFLWVHRSYSQSLSRQPFGYAEKLE